MLTDRKIIGFDAKRALCNKTGLGSYSRTLINDLAKANIDNKYLFILYSPDGGNEDLRNQINTSSDIRYVSPNPQKIKLLRNLWREKGIVKNLIDDKVDIFHGLSGQLPKGIKSNEIKSVVTIHDLIFLAHPEFYNPIDVQIYKHKFYSTLKQADKIIAISECTKQDILRFGNKNPKKPLVSEEKIKVIYQSYNNIYSYHTTEEEKLYIKIKYSLPDKFILNVGSIERRKNILLVVKAMNQVNKNIHLVIIGKHTSYKKEIERYIQNNNLQSRIHFFHDVNNQDLKIIYSLASLFVYPSIYEGFGIPIIEAIANNLPVIATKGSCLEEAGGKGTYYVSPYDVLAMRDAINILLNDEGKRLTSINESKEYIKKFANNDIASKILDLYNSL